MTTVRIYCCSGCKLDLVTQDGATALFYTTLMQKLDLVEAICSRGANLEISSHAGVTALSLAAEKGYHEIVTTLCKNCANIAAWDGLSGNTALHKLSESDHSEVVQVLVQGGARAEAVNKGVDAATPLYWK
jgi:ankyrin repeat protein